MAESSIFWTTGATGDGASPYTQAQVTDWLRRTFLNAPTLEGVLAGFSNALAVTGSTSPIAVAAGAAIVYGFPYENTSPVNLAVTTPSIGTTGHRVVLRVNWAAQTVRIVLKSSSDGVATPPGLTQTAGTTWEISLATLTITTGGAITITDTRSYAHPNLRIGTAQLDNEAVTAAILAGAVAGNGLSGGAGAALAVNVDGSTIEIGSDTLRVKDSGIGTAKLANDSVDDTKVGNRVPQFYRRQGGSGTDWSTQGTSSQTPGAVRMQGGVARFAGPGAAGNVNVTFPVAFSQPPLVFITPRAEGVMVAATNVTASGFTIDSYSEFDVFSNLDFNWLAIGPE
jgi:hypothetical protein